MVVYFEKANDRGSGANRLLNMAFSFDQYDILDELGRGAFGTVYRARQKSLGRTVAIKCLSPHRIQNRHDIIRFRREAQGMAALSHDNILAVIDYAYQGDAYYIVMEYIDGSTLDAALGAGLPRCTLLYALEKTSRALQYAHAEGVVHRDVKPSNILLGKQGQIKLADFGLAAFESGMSHHSSMDGAAVGTLAYMAPEALVSPGDIDNRIDVYALGCILYQILAGSLPFDGESIGEVSYKILNESPAPIPDKAGDAALVDLAIGCLARDRDARPSMETCLDTLWQAVHQDLDRAERELVAFVKCARPGAMRPVKRTTRLPTTRVMRPRLSPRLIGAAAGGAALAIGAIALWRSGGPHFTKTPDLPELSVLESGAGKAPSSRVREKLRVIPSHDGPAPVTGASAGDDVATVIVHGLAPEDTIVINGKPVNMRIRNATIGVPVAPGRNRLEIRRRNGKSLKRAVDVMPFQTIEWDTRAEKTNARK